MASKFGLAGGIPERRVRPIWDAVDSRQYKAALKLCTALLAKHPTSPYVLALKGLILERMGKPDEALSVCLNAKELLYSDNIFHFDDLTLSTLQIVFQRLERLDLATSCYEYACTKYPNNLELMMGLFNCYVREYSYVRQQQTAIKMYKTVGEESGGEKLLPLAEALLKKHINSHSLHEPEALALYVSILEQQSKYGAALEVLSGDLGSLMGREEDKLRLQGRLLAQECNYTAASEIFQKILESCPDDWESFLHYLGCLLEHGMNLPKSRISETTLPLCVDAALALKTSLSEELVESRLASALSFVQTLQGNDTSDCVRGPHLANIEIERQRRLNGNPTDRKFIEALVNYFHRFGHLSCAASDVERYLHMLSSDEITELLDTISRSFDASSLSVKVLGFTITTYKVQELLGIFFSKSTTELQSIAKGMVDTFYKNLPLSRDLDPQESMHGEELLCMASSILVQLFWRTRNLGYLIEAIMVLEFGLTVRKYVTLEVIEFVQFKERLQHSMQYLSVRSDSIILSLKQKAESLEEMESILENVNYGVRLVELSKEDNMKHLTFNEDRQARPWWTPTASVNFLSEPFDEASTSACFRAKACEHKSTENNDPKIKETQRKSLLPRLVYLSMHGCASSLRETELNGSGLDTDAAEMKPLLEKYARSIGYSVDDALSVILGMSSGKKSIKDFAPDIVSWMSFAVFINAWNLWSNESVIPKADQSSPSSWQIVDSLVKICIEEQLIDANRILTSPGNNIPVLVQMITEPISWHLVVIQSCMRSMAPQGKKKKKGGPSERPNIPRLQAIQRSVQCMIDTLRSVQSWLSDQMRPEEQALDILLSYLQGASEDGPGHISCILEENSARHNPELGERVAQSLETWSSAGVVRRIVGAERELLVELKKICDSKLKLLGSLLVSLSSALH
uniref:Uncharacterized protein n=1 Tax=Leersia perrieri TaxID=77586 RepID=A0A0D9WFC3_9ORYZ